MFYEKFWHITIHQMLRKIEHLYRERTALQWRQGGQTFTVTYGKLMEDVWRLAARFQALGLKAQPLVIDGRNTYEQVVAFLAGAAMGAIVAPLSFDLPLENLRDLIARVQPAALVYDQEDRDILTGVTAGCMPVLIPCTDGADSVSVTLSGNGPLYEGDESLSPEAPVLLLATSGSTRRSKLVLLSHYALLPHSELETQRSLFVLPMYHIAGLNSLMNDLARGIPICLSTLGRGILDMAWFQPKDIFAVPSFVELLVQRAKAGKVDLGNLSSLISGGAPQSSETAEYLESLGIYTISLYGATETAGIVDYSLPSRFRRGSVGMPGPWNDIRISPQGEVLVKGPQVMLRYLDDPEATAQALVEGWYHTGDLGSMDQDGFLYITGRISNVIVLSNGENVSPEAVEAKLSGCPDILECAVLGRGDKLVAQVWCGADAGELLKSRIKEFVAAYNRTVPSYLAIRNLEFRDQPFDKTATGKLKRPK